MSFKNKVAIVTGASSGIGAATAIQFAAEGADVVLVGRNEAKLKDVSRKCESKGKKPLTIIADISNDENAKKIVNDTIAKYGKLDILINNAGFDISADILSEKALKVFDDVSNTNLRAVVHLTNLAAPHLVKTKGNIVNISSVASMVPRKNIAAYCTTKAAVNHFTRTIALELASKGVRVNVINPGPVKTDMAANMGIPKEQADKFYAGFEKSLPLRHVAEAQEIADLVMYLASDKARSVTGSNFVIDLGMVLLVSMPDDGSLPDAFK